MKFKQAVKDFMKKFPEFGNRNINESTLTPLSLPDEYNHARFNGTRVVDGVFCNTVGEYKSAWEAKYGDEY